MGGLSKQVYGATEFELGLCYGGIIIIFILKITQYLSIISRHLFEDFLQIIPAYRGGGVMQNDL